MRYVTTLVISSAISLLISSKAMATTYEMVFRLTTPKAYGGMDYKVDYSGAGGDFVNSGTSVDCSVNTALSSLSEQNDNDAGKLLHKALAADPEFQGPIDLYTCNFDKEGAAPVASDFTITLGEWGADTHSTTPQVEITSISSK